MPRDPQLLESALLDAYLRAFERVRGVAARLRGDGTELAELVLVVRDEGAGRRAEIVAGRRSEVLELLGRHADTRVLEAVRVPPKAATVAVVVELLGGDVRVHHLALAELRIVVPTANTNPTNTRPSGARS
ncbi:MAG: hypothetical protein HYV09_18060 [Deltaproteobacteria bacterium]|nr:hypothetical protein [Deltaproteobacteria bacterium]